MRYVLTQSMASPSMPIGGKAKSLSILGCAGAPIPKWIVITPDAFFDSLSPAQREALNSAKTQEEIRDILVQVCLNSKIQTELKKTLAEFFVNSETLVAVRSSALDEDQADASFAGQLQSFMFVPLEKVPEKVMAVWRSGLTEQIMTYRRSKGLPVIPSIPAVLIQQMVNPTISGVAFGADPVSGNIEQVVVSGVYGLGTALVSGEVDADVFHIHPKKGILQAHIAQKTMAAHYDPEAPEGVTLKPIDVPANASCFNQDQLALIIQWVLLCGQTLGTAQDMEWAFEGDQFYILQSRPITTPLQEKANPYFYYWDDDDLDSWRGVTTPLTFSFIQRFYNAKFRHLSQFFGVSKARIMQDKAVYERILGLIQGRIYYNVTSLEEIWAVVPGFRRYRAIFNDWFNMDEPPPMPSLPTTSRFALFREHCSIAWALLKLTWVYFCWDRHMRDFYQNVARAMMLTTCEFQQMNMDRLIHLYRNLDATFSIEWAKPTINNFFASFFYAQLGKMTERWCGDTHSTLRNNLLCGEGDILSTRPIKYLNGLASLAAQKEGFSEILIEKSWEEIHQTLGMHPEFYYQYQCYMLEYGQRCHESSLLESNNIADEPLQFLRQIGVLANRLKKQSEEQSNAFQIQQIYEPSAKELEIRQVAESWVQHCLSKHPLKRACLNWVLYHVRKRVRDRENIRFIQTQVMGRFRQILLAVSGCFQEAGLLKNTQDIFYLEISEVLSYVEGTATCTHLKELAALRKAEFERYQNLESPPACFETQSSVYLNRITKIFAESEEGEIEIDLNNETQQFEMPAVTDDALCGLSSSPGCACGPVRFVVKGKVSGSLTGQEILVAELGDPGLVMLFPSVGGLLFEKGSPLSHLSIVAREMGIPTIVSIPRLSSWLQEGDWVDMDGQTGVIRKLNADEIQQQTPQ